LTSEQLLNALQADDNLREVAMADINLEKLAKMSRGCATGLRGHPVPCVRPSLVSTRAASGEAVARNRVSFQATGACRPVTSNQAVFLSP